MSSDIESEIQSLTDRMSFFGYYKTKAFQEMLAAKVIGKFFDTYTAYIKDHPGDETGAFAAADAYLAGLDNPNTSENEGWDRNRLQEEVDLFLRAIGPDRNQGINTYGDLLGNVNADLSDDGLFNNSTGNNIMLMEIDGIANVNYRTRALWGQSIMFDNMMQDLRNEMSDLSMNARYYADGEDEE